MYKVQTWKLEINEYIYRDTHGSYKEQIYL